VIFNEEDKDESLRAVPEELATDAEGEFCRHIITTEDFASIPDVKDDVFYDLYISYSDIGNSEVAVKDWNIVDNLFLSQQCESLIDEYDQNICNLYKNKDIQGLEEFEYLQL